MKAGGLFDRPNDLGAITLGASGTIHSPGVVETMDADIRAFNEGQTNVAEREICKNPCIDHLQIAS